MTKIENDINVKYRDDIVKVGKLLWEQHFIAGIDGNISIRVNLNHILITPGGKGLGFLKSSEIVYFNYQSVDQLIRSGASSEVNLHIACFEANKNAKAIIHAHPVYSTALSTIGDGILEPILTNIVIQFGVIPVVPYEKPGTKKIAKVVSEYIAKGYKALILQHHGVLAIGDSLEEAYYLIEQIEHLAKTVVVAKQTGVPRCLSEKQIRDLLSLRERFEIKAPNPKLYNFLSCSRWNIIRKAGAIISPFIKREC